MAETHEHHEPQPPQVAANASPRDDDDAAAPSPIESLEIDLLLGGIYHRTGVDYRDHAREPLRRRLWAQVQRERLTTITALIERVLHDDAAMQRLLLDLSLAPAAMFREPAFFLALRERVVPLLKSYSFIRVWLAGCSTGEELYSLAIVLEEEGLYDRTRLYATDMNETVLRRAQAGIYPIEVMQEYTANYMRSGAHAHFSDYYSARYEHAIFRQELRRNVVFAHHNLVTDGPFNEFHLILCRDVLAGYNDRLRGRVNEVFFDSLRRFGILALGRNDTIAGSRHEPDFQAIPGDERLFQRMAP